MYTYIYIYIYTCTYTCVYIYIYIVSYSIVQDRIRLESSPIGSLRVRIRGVLGGLTVDEPGRPYLLLLPCILTVIYIYIYIYTWVYMSRWSCICLPPSLRHPFSPSSFSPSSLNNTLKPCHTKTLKAFSGSPIVRKGRPRSRFGLARFPSYRLHRWRWLFLGGVDWDWLGRTNPQRGATCTTPSPPIKSCPTKSP